jgi:hypothetical protein
MLYIFLAFELFFFSFVFVCLFVCFCFLSTGHFREIKSELGVILTYLVLGLPTVQKDNF